VNSRTLSSLSFGPLTEIAMAPTLVGTPSLTSRGRQSVYPLTFLMLSRAPMNAVTQGPSYS
jgi:hypothetical protein